MQSISKNILCNFLRTSLLSVSQSIQNKLHLLPRQDLAKIVPSKPNSSCTLWHLKILQTDTKKNISAAILESSFIPALPDTSPNKITVSSSKPAPIITVILQAELQPFSKQSSTLAKICYLCVMTDGIGQRGGVQVSLWVNFGEPDKTTHVFNNRNGVHAHIHRWQRWKKRSGPFVCLFCLFGERRIRIACTISQAFAFV